MSKYEIIVGNIGTVHSGSNKREAEKIYNEYMTLSKAKNKENVYFLKDGLPFKSFYWLKGKRELGQITLIKHKKLNKET